MCIQQGELYKVHNALLFACVMWEQTNHKLEICAGKESKGKAKVHHNFIDSTFHKQDCAPFNILSDCTPWYVLLSPWALIGFFKYCISVQPLFCE